MAKGLPASPGAATGQIVFFADDAEAWAEKKKKVVLVRIETSPEDLRGMAVAQGILTMRGGMTWVNAAFQVQAKSRSITKNAPLKWVAKPITKVTGFR